MTQHELHLCAADAMARAAEPFMGSESDSRECANNVAAVLAEMPETVPRIVAGGALRHRMRKFKMRLASGSLYDCAVAMELAWLRVAGEMSVTTGGE